MRKEEERGRDKESVHKEEKKSQCVRVCVDAFVCVCMCGHCQRFHGPVCICMCVFVCVCGEV